MDERFVFGEDELRIDELVFELGYGYASDAWKSAPPDRFLMFKPKGLLESFDRFFSSRPDDPPARAIFEIGIWDGGSTAFWFEYFQPDKLVAVDYLGREDSEYFRSFVDARGIADRVKTYWRVDQGDRERMGEIFDAEFEGALDLVIDDGSHLLEETRACFETLFPRLRKGGLYMLEDWNWEFQPLFREPDHPFAKRDGLIGLIDQCVRVTGSSYAIQSVSVQRGFVAIERGSGPSATAFNFEELLSGLPVKLEG